MGVHVWAGFPGGGGHLDGYSDGDADVCQPGALRALEVAGGGRRDAGLHAVDGAALLRGLRPLQRRPPRPIPRRHRRSARPRHGRSRPAGALCTAGSVSVHSCLPAISAVLDGAHFGGVICPGISRPRDMPLAILERRQVCKESLQCNLKCTGLSSGCEGRTCG